MSAANNTEGEFSSRTIDLRRTAAATAVAIGTVALAALAYRLIDVFLLLFIGIAIAAALQPSHVELCRWGVPKGLAVLLIYLLFFVGLVLIGLVVGPALVEQSRTFGQVQRRSLIIRPVRGETRGKQAEDGPVTLEKLGV